MQPILAMVERVASSDVTVLLHGESGVGKEVLARELHRRSPRRNRPFIKVNCAALPTELLESELFGHEKGAFTGAGTSRIGKFEVADQGTIMLDEIAEMPVALQAKLLHVLQDHQLTRLGSNRPVDVNVRVIAATNRDLEAMRRDGTFREDLYYRLQVIEIHVPPLRERREEITLLAEFFLTKYAGVYRRPAMRPSPALLEAILAYRWPGNVRELENMMKRLVVLQDEAFVLAEIARARPEPAARPVNGRAAPAASRLVPPDDDGGLGVDLPSLARAAALEAERAAIDHALTRFHWNRRKAAQYLHVSYKTLLNKMKECGISEQADTP